MNLFLVYNGDYWWTIIYYLCKWNFVQNGKFGIYKIIFLVKRQEKKKEFKKRNIILQIIFLTLKINACKTLNCLHQNEKVKKRKKKKKKKKKHVGIIESNLYI